MARKTTRLYYGQHPETGKRLYWTLKVKNATRPVSLDGTVEEAMRGKEGISIGCHLSNVARANKSKFPHPALYISFTKSVALVITKIIRGQPAYCIRYRHPYGQYVDLNDVDPTKAVVKAHPELFNRQFTLYPYKTQTYKSKWNRVENGETPKHKMMRGELARMKKAGLIMPALD